MRERRFESAAIARLCTLDSGVEVTPDDVRRYLLVGVSALERFTAEQRHEIQTTIVKELAPDA
jgi:hypothetical protein